MATYGEMIDRLVGDLHRTDQTANIQTGILKAIDFYARKKTYFNEEQATAATVADQEYYQIPAEGREIDTLAITISSTKYIMNRRSFKYLESIATNTTFTGHPSEWAQHRQEIRLYPIPQSAWTMTMAFQESFVDLSETTDTNAFTLNAPTLIEARAKWWVNTRVLRDFEAAQADKQEELEQWQAIETETHRRLSTGKVRPTNF